MEYQIQDEILNLILLSYIENTEEKKETVKEIYQKYDNLITAAGREDLISTVAFIDFIDRLYPTEETVIKGILRVLKEEANKELAFKPEIIASGSFGL